LVLLEGDVFELGLVELLLHILCWLEIEVVASLLEAVLLQGSKSCRGLWLVHVSDTQVALTRKVDTIVLSLLSALRVEVLGTHHHAAVLVKVRSLLRKHIRFANSY
jgi:hypothetical protein